MFRSISIYVLCFSTNFFFTFSLSTHSSLVTVVSSCTSTSIKTRHLHLHCAEGHIRILESFLGSLENRYFGCFHHLEDCTVRKEFRQCQGTPSCDVEVPRQTPILCTSAINDKRRVFSMSAYLQISYECTGKRPHKKAICLKGPSDLALPASNQIKCNENQHILILNILEGRKSFSRSQAHSLVDLTSACSYKSGDELFQSPLSASIGLGCNGHKSCRLPSFSGGHSGDIISYLQIQFACEEGISQVVSRCMNLPPNSVQDISNVKRYLALDCFPGAIQILNSFFGSRSLGTIVGTSCAFESSDIVYPTDVQTCNGRGRCYIPLQEQARSLRYGDSDFLYLQVHYRCLNIVALKPDQTPFADSRSFSIRDYVMNDSNQIELNIFSDAAAESSAQASRSASGKGKGIDHTSTIVGGILLGVSVIGAFLIAYVLNQKNKKRQKLESSLLVPDDGLTATDVVGAVNTEANDLGQTDKTEAKEVIPVNDKPSKDFKTSGNEADEKVSESLMDLINVAEARLLLNQSPTLPRKVDHLPGKCRENPPANVCHYIKKGEKQEFYV